jgi:hypothetical protein
MSAPRAGVSAVATSSEPVKAPTRDFVMEILLVSAGPGPAAGVQIAAAAWRNPPGRRDAGIAAGQRFVYRLNTYSIEAVDVFLSSGIF